ncbi:MAG: UDP-N-acetylmuramate dehydrogenase [Bacteroidales bacterium]|nr:UDP-N-acetylmuramate dehydrogenase [Bacteroidales bacterium]
MDKSMNCSLALMNTFGMKVSAGCVVEYDSIEELVEALGDGSLPRPFLHIGGGSNLLFTGDFPGTVLHSRIRFIQPVRLQDHVLVRVGSGVLWDDLCAWASDHSLWGLENLSLIPGEVGAAAVQNIGAYGVEAADVIETVECYDIKEKTMVSFKAAECGYSYRSSRFKEDWKGRYIVTAVSIRLTSDYSPRLEYGNIRSALTDRYGSFEVESGILTPSRLRDTVIAIRRDKLPDPSVMGSAGSFFRNPVVGREVYENVCRIYGGEAPHYDLPEGVKIPAAWLIDQCGWKGFSEGNAGVYEKQALVIVNRNGKASPDEILSLERRIVESVAARFGITLIPEVEHI